MPTVRIRASAAEPVLEGETGEEREERGARRVRGAEATILVLGCANDSRLSVHVHVKSLRVRVDDAEAAGGDMGAVLDLDLESRMLGDDAALGSRKRRIARRSYAGVGRRGVFTHLQWPDRRWRWREEWGGRRGWTRRC